MSYSIYDNEICIKSQRNIPLWRIFGAIALGLLMLLILFFAGKDIINGDKDISVSGIAALIGVPFFIFHILSYAFNYRDCISINEDHIHFSLLNTNEEVKINAISKAVISNDNCLILYDKTDDVDITADLEWFGYTEIQLLINALCKKIPMTIETDVTQEKGLKLPEYAMTKAFSPTSRKRTVTSDKTKRNTVTDDKEAKRKRVVTNNRKLELSDHKSTEEKSVNKRRLEL